ncbi:hypothetical protein J4E89_003762 [Alternaria sp. Ai002NY15]|nr:hypothetical protein J4E89_003762 [Alternaria sp. Ai002NY15]
MSSDAIIEGLKQGNTVELDVLQNMKEGLNSVVDKMISECLSRNDGLSELTEKLSLETWGQPAAEFTAEDEIKLAKTIEYAIRTCERRIDYNTTRKTEKLQDTAEGFKIQQAVLDFLLTHAKVHDDACDQRAALHNESTDMADGSPHEALIARECGFLDKVFAFHRHAARQLRERKEWSYRQIECDHEIEQLDLQKHMGALFNIAAAAKIDLAAVREDDENDEADEQSCHEKQAAWESHIRSAARLG